MFQGTESTVIDRVESVLKIPRPAIIDEASWHEQALPTLLSDSTMPPERLLQLGVDTIDQLPLAEIAASLDASPHHPKILSTIRQSRKLLLIGRDALMLSATDTSSDQLNPIFDLSRGLGKVVDTAGQKRAALRAAQIAVDEMQTMDFPPLDSVEPATLESRCRNNLHTDFFAHRSIHVNEMIFHEARKQFRQVVHMAILACSDKPSQELISLVATGKVLNMRYGSFHNKIMKNQEALNQFRRGRCERIDGR